MTTAQKNAITSPAIGLSVYDSDNNCSSYYNGIQWVNATTNGSFSTTWNGLTSTTNTVWWSITGSIATIMIPNFISTCSGTTAVITCAGGAPSFLLPNRIQHVSTVIYNNGVQQAGRLTISTGFPLLLFYLDVAGATNFTSGLSYGFQQPTSTASAFEVFTYSLL